MSYGRSTFFRSSGQFLGTNETRNDIYYKIEVLRDHTYLCMLLFSLFTAVFDSRLLFTLDFFCVLHFVLKKSSAKVKKITKLQSKDCWRIVTRSPFHWLSNPHKQEAIRPMANETNYVKTIVSNQSPLGNIKFWTANTYGLIIGNNLIACIFITTHTRSVRKVSGLPL